MLYLKIRQMTDTLKKYLSWPERHKNICNQTFFIYWVVCKVSFRIFGAQKNIQMLLEFQLVTRRKVYVLFFKSFQHTRKRKNICVSSGKYFCVLEDVRNSNFDIIVKCFQCLAQVEPQWTTCIGVRTNLFKAGYRIQSWQSMNLSGLFRLSYA